MSFSDRRESQRSDTATVTAEATRPLYTGEVMRSTGRIAVGPNLASPATALDPDPLLHHAEVLHRDGEAVGYIRAASYGWTLGGAVGLAMVSGGGDPVTPDWLGAGMWEVDIAGIRHPVEVSLRPMYDPTSARIKV